MLIYSNIDDLILIMIIYSNFDDLILIIYNANQKVHSLMKEKEETWGTYRPAS